MSENDEMKNQIVPLTDGFDGFEHRVEGDDDDGRVAPGGGDITKFTNNTTYELRDGTQVSSELELIVGDILRVVVKWVNQAVVEQRVLAPGERVPDIAALNNACPKSEWGVDFNNNPKGPWAFQHLLLLLDPKTMDKYRLPTSTVGGGIAVRELVDKTKMMRRYRGEQVYPIIKLADKFMNTRFGGRQRPHFVVQRWVQFGGDKPALAAPTEPPKTDLPGTKVVTEPSLSEQMRDEVPWNDSPDIDTPKTASPPMQHKPTAPQKPSINKRGVQKIAGGRR
jgi:hypothetical protein